MAVGRSLPRIDIIEKAMGEARYSNDTPAQETLSLAIVGSPRPHIRIRRLDVTEALEVPGVLQVLTAHDIPGKNRLPWGEQPFLVEGEALFHGQPVALVLAEHPIDAQEGARKVRIEYDELPALTKIEAALAEEAPSLYTGEDGKNIWKRFAREQGDVDTAFGQSEQVIQREYQTPEQVSASIEPAGVMAQPSSDGGIYIEGSIEAPFAVQAAIANLLDLPYHRIYVVQRTLGGGTGSKAEGATWVAGYAALAAWLTGRPTRLVLSREEDYCLGGRRPATWARIKYGASREGKLHACEVELRVQAGAYAGLVEMAMWRALAHASGPYHIPHLRVRVEAIATHTAPFGLLAGYGQLPLSFAQECLLDELAQRISIDPVSLRRTNMLTPEHPLPWQSTPDPSNQLAKALDAVLSRSQWETRRKPLERTNIEERDESWRKRTRRGMGLSLSYFGLTVGAESSMPPQATVSVRLQRDGSVQVSTPQAKTGRGTRTLLAQIAAESLSIPYHSVHILETDTLHSSGSALHTIPPNLLVTGLALLDASRPLQQQILEVAAKHFQCAAEEITRAPGRLQGPNEQSISFAQAVDLCWRAGVPTARYGHAVLFPPGEAEGRLPAYFAYGYAAHVAEVEVDLDTLQVEILDLYAACDMGQAINPSQAEADLEAQLIQGLGFALIEEMAQTGGMVLNGPLLSYPIPEFRDTPRLHPILIETPFSQGPYGTKGLDDLAMIGVTPAILNAVANALGRRVYQLPVTPERLYSTTNSQTQ